MKSNQLIFVLLSTIALSACVPRMQQVKNYIPPVTDFGMQCLEKADQSRNRCELANQKRIAECHSRAEQQATEILAVQEKQYTFALEDYIDAEKGYELAVADYEEQKRLLRNDGELAYVKCSNDVNLSRMAEFPRCKKMLDDAYRRANQLSAPRAPDRPRRPTYESIVAGLKRDCNSVKVNCGVLYDESYKACGGQIDYQSICVANCQ